MQDSRDNSSEPTYHLVEVANAPPVSHEESSDDDNFTATLQQFLHLFRKRKWLILAVSLGALTVGGISSALRTPTYISTARIQINNEASKVVEGGGSLINETGGRQFLRTEYELLKTHAVAQRIASALQLDEDQDFLNPRSSSLLSMLRDMLTSETDSPSDLLDEATQIIEEKTRIRPVPGSRLVDLIAEDSNPARARRIANAFAEAYIAANLDKRLQASEYAKTFLKDQIKQLKIRLEQSEKELLAFSEREQFIQVTEQENLAERNLAAANVALGTLLSERIKNEQLWRQTETADSLNLPQFVASSAIQDLRALLKQYGQEYQEKLGTFKPDHPHMIQYGKKIKQVEQQLATEVKAVRGTLYAAYQSSRAQEDEMKKQVEKLEGLLLGLQRKGIQYNILKREVETNRRLYDDLLKRYKEVGIASHVGTSNVFVVDRARMPVAPSSPRVGRALILSLVLGLGAGFALTYLVELLDDRIRSREDLEQVTGLATLGIIPSVAPGQSFDDESEAPLSPVSEAYRSLATALQFSTRFGLPRSIAITSTGVSEGKSTTAMLLARHFGRIGHRVLLIDGDLRKPTLHERIGLDNSFGLSNYLTGSCSPQEVIQETGFTNVVFMASGPPPPNAADLLGGTRLFSLVSEGQEVFDLIIIDGPPLLGLADAQLMASATSATLYVVSSGQERKEAVRSALRQLRLGRGNVIGAVLTKFDFKAAGYRYAYGGDYAYTTDKSPSRVEAVAHQEVEKAAAEK